MRTGAALLGLVIGSAAGPSSAATLTGTVTWSEPMAFEPVAPTIDPNICGADGPLRRRHVAVDARGRVAGAVVYLPDLDTPKAVPRRVEIALEGCRFVPRIAALVTGTEVRFVSKDPILHNVTLIGPQGEVLESATLVTAGQVTRWWRLDEAGLHRLTSAAGHDWMNGHLWVYDGGSVAITDEAGHFRLEDLGVGPHRAVAWHPDLGVTETTISAPRFAKRPDVELRF